MFHWSDNRMITFPHQNKKYNFPVFDRFKWNHIQLFDAWLCVSDCFVLRQNHDIICNVNDDSTVIFFFGFYENFSFKTRVFQIFQTSFFTSNFISNGKKKRQLLTKTHPLDRLLLPNIHTIMFLNCSSVRSYGKKGLELYKHNILNVPVYYGAIVLFHHFQWCSTLVPKAKK